MKAMMAIAVGAALATVAMVEGVARAEPPPPPPGACAMQEAAIYFKKHGVALNVSSQRIVARLAAEAKACGRSLVFADAPDGALQAQRASAIADAFAANGVHAILVHAPSTRTLPAEENVLDRAAVLRVVIAPPNS